MCLQTRPMSFSLSLSGFLGHVHGFVLLFWIVAFPLDMHVACSFSSELSNPFILRFSLFVSECCILLRSLCSTQLLTDSQLKIQPYFLNKTVFFLFQWHLIRPHSLLMKYTSSSKPMTWQRNVKMNWRRELNGPWVKPVEPSYSFSPNSLCVATLLMPSWSKPNQCCLMMQCCPITRFVPSFKHLFLLQTNYRNTCVRRY